MCLPGVRFAVDAYVNFARRAPWQEAVCSSLTELFAPEIHKQRLANWPEHYPWIDPCGSASTFRAASASRAATWSSGSPSRSTGSTTRAAQERALEILQFKLDVLWQMNDAMAQRYGVSIMSDIGATAKPSIGRGLRLQWEPAQNAHVLLYPEGMVKLNASAGEILKRCDGQRTRRRNHHRPRAGIRRHRPDRRCHGVRVLCAGAEMAGTSSLSEPTGTLARPGPPLWLLLELTYRCPLHCVYCSNPTDFARTEQELGTDDWIRVLREARALGAVQLGLSGGEPLMRDDLEAIVAEAHTLGFYTNLITSGVGSTKRASRRSRTQASTTFSSHFRTARGR